MTTTTDELSSLDRCHYHRCSPLRRLLNEEGSEEGGPLLIHRASWTQPSASFALEWPNVSGDVFVPLRPSSRVTLPASPVIAMPSLLVTAPPRRNRPVPD